jgi:glycosyltransferase involved in cell wall biosynthesis
LIVAGIPAYNVEKTIRQVIEAAAKHVNKVIVVDDGSKDMTAKISEEAGAIVIKHRKNRGIGPTRASILKKAAEMNADILVMLDGDGQHDPNDIPGVIEPVLKDEADICVGYRIVRKGHMPLYRRLGHSIRIHCLV